MSLYNTYYNYKRKKNPELINYEICMINMTTSVPRLKAFSDRLHDNFP